MEDEDDQPITLVLGHAEALVLFELLSRNIDDLGNGFHIVLDFQAEQRVTWKLKALLESRLAEPFMPNYLALLDAARLAVQGNYNPATGEDLPNDRVWPAMGYGDRE